MAEQFLRLSNNILRRKEPGLNRLADVGLYALLSTYLSIPSFRTPNGGMRKAIAKHCRNGRHSRDAAWRHLYLAGFLKRNRYSDGNGNLKDLYTLLPCADHSIPPRNFLKVTDGRAALAARLPLQLPRNNYTPISYRALQDPRLSLETKGLYALLCYHIEIAKNSSLFLVSREHLLETSGVGSCAFRRMWNELKTYGYLQIQRGWDHEHGRISYCYTVETEGKKDSAPKIPPASPSTLLSSPLQTKLFHRASEIQQGSSVQKRPQSSLSRAVPDPSEFAWTKEGVEVQLEYDVLLSRENPKEFLNLISDVIAEVYLLPEDNILYVSQIPRKAFEIQAILHKLEAEDIENVLSRIKGKGIENIRKIRNFRTYILTCLCHIREEKIVEALTSY